MIRLIKLLTVTTYIFMLSSCGKKDSITTPADPNIKFKSTLTGAQQTPSNASVATGSAFATYNTDTKLFFVSITYSAGFAPTDGYIHKGAIGISGPSVIHFTSVSGEAVLTYITATQGADLMSNLYYLNIHSSAYPEGEIRGQLLKQ